VQLIATLPKHSNHLQTILNYSCINDAVIESLNNGKRINNGYQQKTSFVSIIYWGTSNTTSFANDPIGGFSQQSQVIFHHCTFILLQITTFCPQIIHLMKKT
jgi:hypothetical protein